MIGAVSIFGVAIKHVRDEQNHAGLVYLDDNDGCLKIIHLAWHYQLRTHALPVDYKTCRLTGFDNDELDLFAVRAARMSEGNLSGIPYGFRYDGAADFNQDLSFINEEGSGLTCATFVLSFFKQMAINIVDLSTWETRADDVKWQQSIVRDLAVYLDGAELASQKNLIGSAYRFRPEEAVASAHLFEGSSLTFNESKAAGEALLAEMRMA